MAFAMTWSTEIPSLMSAPVGFAGRAPVRNDAFARAWSPPPSMPAVPFLVGELAEDVEMVLELGVGHVVGPNWKSAPCR